MKYKVEIPNEDFAIFEFEQEGLLGIATVNIALHDFKTKEVFAYHLSILIELDELADNGMPSESEIAIIDKFEDDLDLIIKGKIRKKPNAIFLARVIWNGTIEIIWRVYMADTTNSCLQKIISEKASPRYFDFRIDYDSNWELAKWHLDNAVD